MDLLPGRPQHAIRGHVSHGEFVQAAHQPVALLLVDDKGQVEVVGGLRHEVDLLLLEELERVAEPVHHGTDIAADKAHRRARSYDLDPADTRQVLYQPLHHARLERVDRRIERDRDAGLGGGHQVDREPVILEHGERIGKKADLVPHPQGLHRHQRNALLDAHRLDPRTAVATCRGDLRTVVLGELGRVYGERDRVLLCGEDAARVQHLGAAAGDLLRLVVVERAQETRTGHRVGIRCEHARHVRPDLESPRAELGGEIAGARVGAAAPEQHGFALRVARDETLGQIDHAVARQPPLQLGIGLEVAGRRQEVDALVGVRPLLGAQQAARVQPLDVEALRAEVRGAEPCRHQLARRHHPRAQTVADLADQLYPRCDAAKFLQVLLEIGDGLHAELACERTVTLLDLRHHRGPVAGWRTEQELLQSVGDPRQCRVHDHRPYDLGESHPHDGGDVLPVARVRYAGAAEFQDDPGRIGSGAHQGPPAPRSGAAGGSLPAFRCRRRSPSIPSSDASRPARPRACSRPPCRV